MKNQPIVVVRKRRSGNHAAAHGGAWKIAYADFMTAMMAFFLVMWLISIASPQELATIAEYFRTPLNVAVTGGDRSSTDSSPIPGGGEDPTRKEGDVNKSINDMRDSLEKKKLNKLRERLDQLIESDPRLRVLRPQLLINLVDAGLRIQIIDSQNRPMFETGSARVEPYMRDVLRGIAPILNDIPNKISISGHTDSIPYVNGERGYSNWELSSDRANASRRELITGGLAEGKILRVIGMGPTMSLAPKQPDAAINRRISLLVLNRETELSIEHENVQGQGVEVNSAQGLNQQPALKAAADASSQSGKAGTPAVPAVTPVSGQTSVPGQTPVSGQASASATAPSAAQTPTSSGALSSGATASSASAPGQTPASEAALTNGITAPSAPAQSTIPAGAQSNGAAAGAGHTATPAGAASHGLTSTPTAAKSGGPTGAMPPAPNAIPATTAAPATAPAASRPLAPAASPTVAPAAVPASSPAGASAPAASPSNERDTQQR